MSRKWWFTVAAALVTATLYRNRLRAYLEQASTNVRAFDLPSAGAYDTLVASILEGLYARVAGEVAAAHPGGKVLEVGSGPSRLAVRLAREAPGMTLTGVDISDAMVERAARRAAGAGLSERVRFEVGDVAALPISDGEIDGVVSTLSLHRWSDPASGLDEIYRVLKPGEPVAQAGLAGEERDPVCGMRFDPLVPLEYGGESYHFCSESCREQFKATPEYFLRAMSYRS